MSAVEVVRRLHAQWGSIAADEAGAKEWRRVVERVSPTHADRAATQLIDNWTRDRAPRIGDWHDAVRATAPRREERWEDAKPATPEARARVVAMLREAAASVDAKRLELGPASQSETPLQRAVRLRRRVEAGKAQP